jgi:hypothetical protein
MVLNPPVFNEADGPLFRVMRAWGVIYNMLGSITPEENSTYLPIIISFKEVEITDTYHKFLGLTRIGNTMAVSWILPDLRLILAVSI